MRVSHNMMSRQFLSNLNNLYRNMAYSHKQVSTGKAFFKVSDDPINAVKSMDIKAELQRSELYQRNIEEAQVVLEEQEIGISHVSESLVKVQGVLNQGLNGTYNDNDRESMAKVVDSNKETILALLNKDYAGKYIFGGYNTSSSPLRNPSAGEYTYNGENIHTGIDLASYNQYAGETMNYNTGKGSGVDVSLSALEIIGYGEDNLFKLMDDISNELKNPPLDNDKLNGFLSEVTGYFDDLQVTRSSVGSKISNLDSLKEQSISNQNNLKELQSQVSEIDIEEAFIEYQTSLMVYNAALKVGANTIQPTLVDFLR